MMSEILIRNLSNTMLGPYLYRVTFIMNKEELRMSKVG